MTDSKLTVEFNARDKLSGELKRVESGVIRFVGAVSAAFAGLAVIGFPVAASAKFQRELLETAKTTDFTREQLGALRKELVQLSKQSDISATDLAKIATMGGQLGIGQNGNVQALAEFTTELARAVTALDVPADQAAAAFGKLINIFDLKPDQFRNAISSLNQVSNTSNATADQLFDVMRRIGNLGGSVDFPAATAIAGTMIDLGLTSETAGTTMVKVFANMKAKANEFATLTGKSLRGWIDLVETDGVGALNAYLDALNGMSAEAAAQTRIELTGGGRIFEAVGKLQQQRERTVALEAKVTALEAERLNLARQEGTADPRVAALDKQIDRYQRLAVQSSTLARLNGEARDGWRDASSAIREQQVVMGGLDRQWDRFSNRATAALMQLGDALLPALTRALGFLGDAIDTEANFDSIAQSATRFVDALALLGGALGTLSSSVVGVGAVDLGALIDIAALLAAVGVVKLLGSAFTVAGAALYRSIPGLTAFTASLLGTTAAQREAAAVAAANNTQQARSGGFMERTAAAAAKLSRTFTVLVGLEQRQATLNQRITTTEIALTSALVARNAAMQGLARGRNTEALLIASVANAELRLNAARAAGDNRSASRINRDLVRWQAQLTLIQSTGLAVTQLQARMARLDATVLSNTNAMDRLNTSGVRAANAMVSAFERARVGASAAVAAIGAVSADLALRTGLAGRLAGQALSTGIRTGVARGLAGLGAVVGPVAAAAIYAPLAATATRVTAAFSKMATAVRAEFGILATAPAGVTAALTRLRAVINSTTQAVGRLALQVTGLGAAWAAAGTSAAKAVVAMRVGAALLSAGIGKLGVGLRFVGSLLSRLLGVGFFAWLAYDVLKLTGLMEPLKRAVVDFAGSLGIDLSGLIKTEAQLAEIAKAAEVAQKAMEKLHAAATQFKPGDAAEVLELSDFGTAQIKLTFDESDPAAAIARVEGLITASYLSQAKIADNQAGIIENNLELRKQEIELAERQGALTKAAAKAEREIADLRARPVLGQDPAKTTQIEEDARGAQRRAEEAVKATEVRIAGLTRANATFERGIEDAGDSVASLANAYGALLTEGEARTLLLAPDGADTSLLENYAAVTLKVVEAQEKLDKAVENERSAASNSNVDDRTVVDLNRRREALEEATQELEMATGAQLMYEAQIATSTTSAERYRVITEQTNTSVQTAGRVAVDATRKLSALTAAQDKLGVLNLQFTGNALPQIEESNILKIGADLLVVNKMASMYRQLQSMAKANAERTKNYAANALAEVARIAQATEKQAAQVQEAFARAQGRSREQTSDRGVDADLRAKLQALDVEQGVRDAMLESFFSGEQRLLAEQLDGGIRVDAQLEKAYRARAEAQFKMDEENLKKRQALEDAASLKKAQSGVANDMVRYLRLTQAVRSYGEEVRKANAVLEDPSSTTDQKAAAVSVREKQLDRYTSGLQEVAKLQESLANTEPVGGELVIPESTINKMVADYSKLAEIQGVLTLDQADKVNPVYQAQEKQFSAMVKTLEIKGDVLREALKSIASESGQAFDSVLKSIAATIDATGVYGTALDSIAKRQQDALANPGQTGVAQFRVDDTALREQVKGALDGLALQPIEVDIAPDAKARIDAMLRVFEGQDMAPPDKPVNIKAVITDATVAPGVQVKGLTAWIEANITGVAKARGGPIGSAPRIPQFARGGAPEGSVRGPGTGTSDSILAWLSNGEHVMDALTVSRFGSGFFSFLQRVARGGGAGSLMKGFQGAGLPGFVRGGAVRQALSGLRLPEFARGGPAAPGVSSFAGIANDFIAGKGEDTTRDHMEIVLKSGDSTSTIYAERSQARALVDILGKLKG